MTSRLTGRRIAFLVANFGVEQSELTGPWQALADAGAQPVLVAAEKEKVQATKGGVTLGDTFDPDQAVGDSSSDDFDALVLPGGVANPDRLRLVADAVAFTQGFVATAKPVAAICHGPWTLVEADVLRGKTLTSWPSLRTDIRNAGGHWLDAEVLTCTENGWTLITSRKPDDLPAFNEAAIEAFAGA